MLNLTRDANGQQSIVIAGCIRIWLKRKSGDRIGVAIEAPDGIPVHRGELLGLADVATLHQLAAAEVLAAAGRLQDTGDDLPAIGAPAEADVDLLIQDNPRRFDHLDQAAELARCLNRTAEATTLEQLLDGHTERLPRVQVRQHLRAVADLLSDPQLQDAHRQFLLGATAADVAATLHQLELELAGPALHPEGGAA